ncbi:hypothetical protein ESA94_16185 [Lacibacter luteus]|uniref:Uncharacterized protein n=1 Tax=Lacibacter luteus TaxID=2508719 RepID=A0A4Q1CGM4_9BACT|nr:hypothetical protein [Lacibacter luteus]RXK58925.1 hypothetical protein ESA94_16185 [Lacibacter luteus]
MFTQTWRKYLPVIQILLKRSAQTEQLLQMNHTDFERASGGRKTRYSFNKLELDNARMIGQMKQPPFAKEFAAFLLEDEATKRILAGKKIEFSMTTAFSLSIKQLEHETLSETNEIITETDEADTAE